MERKYGKIDYPEHDLRRFYKDHGGLWSEIRRFCEDDLIDENFNFLEAIYNKEPDWPDAVMARFIGEGKPETINISSQMADAITKAYDEDDQNAFSELIEDAGREVANLLCTNAGWGKFWGSDAFWEYHLGNGGSSEDFRYPVDLESFIEEYISFGLTDEIRQMGEDLIRKEGKALTLKTLLKRLEREGLKRIKLYDSFAASELLGVDNPVYIQRFMDQCRNPNLEWREALRLAQDPIQLMGYLGTSEEFIGMLIDEGFIPDIRPGVQTVDEDGEEDDDDDNSEDGGNNLAGTVEDGSDVDPVGPSAGGSDGDDDHSEGGRNASDDDRFRGFSRTFQDDPIEGVPPSQAHEDESRGAQAGGQAREDAQHQNGNAPATPAATAAEGASPLLQLIRSARHLHGTQTVQTGMQNVRDALIERDMGAAEAAAHELAIALLGGRGDLQSAGLSRTVQKVANLIVTEIDGALSEDEKKPVKPAQGGDWPGPGNDRPGPDGGHPGAGAASGGTGSGGSGGSGPSVQERPASVYDRGTMERMERERNQSAGTKEDLTALVSTEIREIAEMLVQKKNEEAVQRAVALSKRLQGNGGVVPEMPPQTILKAAQGKAAALRDSNPEPSPSQPVVGEDGVEDDDPEITLDPETAAKLVPVTDWKAFCGIYKIDEKEIKNIKALALKAVWEPKDAVKGCKSIISRRKVNGKDQVPIKNEKYLAQALVHAVKMKAAAKKLTKPMKPSSKAGL